MIETFLKTTHTTVHDVDKEVPGPKPPKQHNMQCYLKIRNIAKFPSTYKGRQVLNAWKACHGIIEFAQEQAKPNKQVETSGSAPPGEVGPWETP